MIILLHVLIALSSIIFTTFSYFYFRPSKNKLRVAAGLTALTLASGTYLVIAMHAALLSACFSGLAYLGVVSLGMYATYRKLASEKA